MDHIRVPITAATDKSRSTHDRLPAAADATDPADATSGTAIPECPATVGPLQYTQQYAPQYTAQADTPQYDAPQYDQQYNAPQYPNGTPYPPAPQYPTQARAPMPAAGQPYGVTSLGGWIGTVILSAIPVVGFILLICWAAGMGGAEHQDRRNWALAQIIVQVVAIVLVIIISAASGFSLMEMFDQSQY